MTKRCIKGVLCVENITLILFVILGLLVFLFYKSSSTSGQPQMQTQPQMQDHSPALMMSPKPNTFFTNDSEDVLSNPYTPPLKDNMLLKGMGMSSGQAGAGPGIPINIATSSAVNTSYRQIGLLTKSSGNGGTGGSGASSSDPVILPLMGKPLFTSRDKWMFYTISDKNNSMKLPIIIKGRNALSEIGVDNVYTGDTVYVQGYNETFKVTLYENSTPQYIPFL